MFNVITLADKRFRFTKTITHFPINNISKLHVKTPITSYLEHVFTCFIKHCTGHVHSSAT